MAVLGTTLATPDVVTGRPRDVALRFRLGELRLWTATLRLCVDTRHFSRLPTFDAEAVDTLDDLPADVDGRLTRSCPVTAPLPRVLVTPDLIRYVPQQYHRQFIRLDGTFDSYMARFSAKTRSTLRRKIRKMAEASGGTTDLREYRTPDQMRAFYRIARQISQRTYQERLLDAGLPAGPCFEQEMQSRADQGRARGYLLMCRETPAAYLYCPIDDGVALYQFVGYDPEFEKWSPGTVLLLLALERLFADDTVCVFDFTEGDGPHKAQFATDHTLCADIYALRNTHRNRMIVRGHTTIDTTSRVIGRLLERLRLKRRIKMLIRGR